MVKKPRKSGLYQNFFDTFSKVFSREEAEELSQIALRYFDHTNGEERAASMLSAIQELKIVSKVKKEIEKYHSFLLGRKLPDDGGLVELLESERLAKVKIEGLLDSLCDEELLPEKDGPSKKVEPLSSVARLSQLLEKQEKRRQTAAPAGSDPYCLASTLGALGVTQALDSDTRRKLERTCEKGVEEFRKNHPRSSEGFAKAAASAYAISTSQDLPELSKHEAAIAAAKSFGVGGPTAYFYVLEFDGAEEKREEEPLEEERPVKKAEPSKVRLIEESLSISLSGKEWKSVEREAKTVYAMLNKKQNPRNDDLARAACFSVSLYEALGGELSKKKVAFAVSTAAGVKKSSTYGKMRRLMQWKESDEGRDGEKEHVNGSALPSVTSHEFLPEKEESGFSSDTRLYAETMANALPDVLNTLGVDPAVFSEDLLEDVIEEASDRYESRVSDNESADLDLYAAFALSEAVTSLLGEGISFSEKGVPEVVADVFRVEASDLENLSFIEKMRRRPGEGEGREHVASFDLLKEISNELSLDLESSQLYAIRALADSDYSKVLLGLENSSGNRNMETRKVEVVSRNVLKALGERPKTSIKKVVKATASRFGEASFEWAYKLVRENLKDDVKKMYRPGRRSASAGVENEEDDSLQNAFDEMGIPSEDREEFENRYAEFHEKFVDKHPSSRKGVGQAAASACAIMEMTDGHSKREVSLLTSGALEVNFTTVYHYVCEMTPSKKSRGRPSRREVIEAERGKPKKVERKRRAPAKLAGKAGTLSRQEMLDVFGERGEEILKVSHESPLNIEGYEFLYDMLYAEMMIHQDGRFYGQSAFQPNATEDDEVKPKEYFSEKALSDFAFTAKVFQQLYALGIESVGDDELVEEVAAALGIEEIEGAEGRIRSAVHHLLGRSLVRYEKQRDTSGWFSFSFSLQPSSYYSSVIEGRKKEVREELLKRKADCETVDYLCPVDDCPKVGNIDEAMNVGFRCTEHNVLLHDARMAYCPETGCDYSDGRETVCPEHGERLEYSYLLRDEKRVKRALSVLDSQSVSK